MLKKIITCISLALVVALLPLGFVGCKSGISGKYQMTELYVTIVDKEGQTTELKLDSDENLVKTVPFGAFAEMGDEQSKEMYAAILSLFKLGVGFEFNKKGTVEVYIPEDLDLDAAAESLSPLMNMDMAAVVGEEVATPVDEEAAAPSTDMTVQDIKDMIAHFLCDLNWFKDGNNVYVTGTIKYPIDMAMSGSFDLEAIDHLNTINVYNNAYFRLDVGKKSLSLSLTFTYYQMITPDGLILDADHNVWRDANGNYATYKNGVASENAPADLIVNDDFNYAKYDTDNKTEVREKDENGNYITITETYKLVFTK